MKGDRSFIQYIFIFAIAFQCSKEPVLINSENNPAESHKDIVIKVKFSPNGKILASGGNDSDLILWDGQNGKFIRLLQGDYDKIFDIAFLESNHEIFTANYEGSIITWDDYKGIKKTERLENNFISDFDFYQPGGFFIASSWDTSILVLKIQDHSLIKKCISEDYKIRTIGYSEKTKSIYAGTASGNLIRWDFDQCAHGINFSQNIHNDAVISIDINDSLNLFVSSSADGEVKIFNLDTLKETATLKGHKSSVNSVKIIPQLQKIASADKDGKIFFWDIKTHDKVILTAHTDPINSIDVSPDGKLLASGSSDRTVKLWNIKKIYAASSK